MNETVNISNNAFLRQIHERAKAEGKEEGKVTGKAEGLQLTLQGKFGRLPAWAVQRVDTADAAQLDRWFKKQAKADTLEAVLGRPPAD